MSLDSRQMRLALAVLFAVVAVLALLWFALLRTVYVPVYQNIREADASAIVAQLDTAGIPYRLDNGGHDVLVPEDQAADARVAVAGSSVSLGGTVGFELFNDSDMGLTEFAQKINFQRAMQGELARTIMMMEGVEFARVHLAIPERSIFRASQGVATAAVQIEMQPGQRLSPARIRGVRQLVSSSVPGLAVEDVAVLDDRGDLVSASLGASGGIAPVNERAALEALYAIRTRKAVDAVVPDLRYDVEISVRPRDAMALEDDVQADGVAPPEGGADAGPALSASGDAPRADPARGAVALRVMIRTPQALASEEREAIETALVQELGLSETRGDVLNFVTGALTAATLPVGGDGYGADAQPSAPVAARGEWGDAWAGLLFSRWTLILLALFGLVLLVVIPRRRLSAQDTATFADLLKGAAAEREGALRE